ncbi:MAG: hypothetical protein ACYCOU_12755 [Sulfobacillus sp.]
MTENLREVVKLIRELPLELQGYLLSFVSPATIYSSQDDLAKMSAFARHAFAEALAWMSYDPWSFNFLSIGIAEGKSKDGADPPVAVLNAYGQLLLDGRACCGHYRQLLQCFDGTIYLVFDDGQVGCYSPEDVNDLRDNHVFEVLPEEGRLVRDSTGNKIKARWILAQTHMEAFLSEDGKTVWVRNGATWTANEVPESSVVLMDHQCISSTGVKTYDSTGKMIWSGSAIQLSLPKVRTPFTSDSFNDHVVFNLEDLASPSLGAGYSSDASGTIEYQVCTYRVPMRADANIVCGYHVSSPAHYLLFSDGQWGRRVNKTVHAGFSPQFKLRPDLPNPYVFAK